MKIIKASISVAAAKSSAGNGGLENNSVKKA